jgi:hypothetical protein
VSATAGSARRRDRVFLLVGLFVAFVLAGFVSGFAGSSPDGLEKVAEDKGLLGAARDHAFAGFPIADYAVSGIDDQRLAGGLAGVIGVVVAFTAGGAIVFAVVRLRPVLARRRHAPAGAPAAAGGGAADPGAGQASG